MSFDAVKKIEELKKSDIISSGCQLCGDALSEGGKYELVKAEVLKDMNSAGLILRHKPEVIGITIDEHGWANVEELIQGIAKNNPGFNKEFLEEIVRTDNKQRYSFNDDKTLIRANQGHSIPVDVELEEKEPPKILYHGTGEKYIASIDQNGLIPKSRLYVHLSKDVETAKAVGKRHGKEVVYSINSEQMYKDGYKFYLSKNGVWLTKRVPVKYLMKEV